MSIDTAAEPQPRGPILRTLPAAADSAALPSPLTSFVGRDGELQALHALFAREDIRLVTITGPGGVGKTRLASQLAHRIGATFANGAVFVALAPVCEPKVVLGTIASSLGMRDVAGSSAKDRLADHCRDLHLLVVLDNLEHLLESASDLAELLHRCPGFTFLCTSRTRLDIGGEHVYPLSPLSVAHGVELFAHRARVIAPAFPEIDDARADIAEVCRRLDGLPLAIELAAARAPVLSPRAMLARLDDRMSLLSGGRRDAPDRHRGLREAIAWSDDLLSVADQRLFRRLAVFVGGFSLEAASAVAGDGHDTLSGIASLEASSLVHRVSGERDDARFAMLETIRDFAAERLRESGEEPAIRRRHADYFAWRAEDTERVWWHSGGLDKLDELEPEVPNLRAALAWLQQSGDVPGLLGLAGSLAPMWAARGYSREGRAWLEWGLPLSDGTQTPSLTVALRALGWILNQHGEMYRSLVIAQHALTLAEADGDSRNRVASLMLSGIAANGMRHPDWSMEWYAVAFEELKRNAGEAWAPVSHCIAMNLMGGLLLGQGEIDQAEAWFLKMKATQQDLGLRFTPAGHAFKGLGVVARARGEPERALDHFQSALRYAREVRDVRQIASCLGAIAGALSAMGHFEAAARLFGASEAHHERISFPFVPETFAPQRALGLPEPWASMHPECEVADALRRTLLERTVAARAVTLDAALASGWWAEGRSMTLDEAVALAFAEPAHFPVPTASPIGLSPREIEVLGLLAEGKSNRVIAATLFLSTRTVERHVLHILAKLHCDTRTAAAAWAIRHDMA